MEDNSDKRDKGVIDAIDLSPGLGEQDNWLVKFTYADKLEAYIELRPAAVAALAAVFEERKDKMGRVEEIITKFLDYSFKGADFTYVRLSSAEKEFCKQEEFDEIIHWMHERRDPNAGIRAQFNKIVTQYVDGAITLEETFNAVIARLTDAGVVKTEAPK